MRRLALHSLPVLVLAMACMQTPPEPGGDPNCENRIGGSSVGCGNPIKGVAQSEIKTGECTVGDCLASHASMPYRIQLGEAITFEWLPFQLLLGLTQPDSFETKRIEIRYGGQLHLIDSLPLKTLYSDSRSSTSITFTEACEAIDYPDLVCSGRKWKRVPITLSVSIAFRASNAWWNQTIEVSDLFLNTQTKRIESDRINSSDVYHAAFLSGYYNQEVLWKTSLNPGQFRVIFIPGTVHYGIACDDTSRLNMGDLPLGSHRLSVITVSQIDTAHWFKVRFLDSVHVVYGLDDEPPEERLIEGEIIDSVKAPPGFGYGPGFTACP